MQTPTEALTQALAGRYTIERPIGEGGMATVFLAEDIKHRRKVAIKVIRPDIAKVVGVERFLREIEIAARLQHPHVMALHDSGEAGGLVYYVMPFVDGMSLRGRLEQAHQLPIEEVVRIVRDVASALTHAHALGIVHRDIKPENILLSEDSAIVTDFGIARAVAAGDQRMTQTGVALGTPLYMSPEQATGGEVDGRSDVYSLACMVYEMLTGEPPYPGSVFQSLQTSPSANPVQPNRPLPGGLSSALQAVVLGGLSMKPADRFASATEFADALANAATASTAAPPDRRAEHRRSVGTRVRWWALGVVALLLTILGGWTLYRSLRPAPHTGSPRIAVLQFTHIGDAEDRFIAAGLTEEIRTRVAGMPGLVVIAAASAGRYDSSTALADIARDLKVDYVLTGTVQTARDPNGTGHLRVFPRLIRVPTGEEVWTGASFDQPLAAGGFFDVQSAVGDQVARALGVSLPLSGGREVRPTENAVAYEAWLQGSVFTGRRYDEPSARGAVTSYTRAVAADSTFALAWARLAEAQTIYYYFHDRARARLDSARTAIGRAFALRPNLLEARIARGYLRWWGELDGPGAMEDLSEVRRLQPNNSEVLWIIGTVEVRQGHPLAALETLREAFERDPRSQIYALDLSRAAMVLRRYDDAIAYADQATAIAPDWAVAALQKALVYWLQADTANARKAISQARASGAGVRDLLRFTIRRYPEFTFVLGREIRDTLEALSAGAGVADPGSLYLAKALSLRYGPDPGRARAQYDSARVALEARVQASPLESDFHSMLGLAYAGLGRRADAEREGDRAIELLPLAREAVGGVYPLLMRARIAALLGDVDTAVRHLQTLLGVPSVLSKAVLRLDPTFEPIRSDPRFVRLIQGPENRL